MSLSLNVDPRRPQDAHLLLAAEVVQAGGVIVYPTETLYGIGADAYNATAVCKVAALKRREENKPMLLILHTPEQLDEVAIGVGPVARKLIARFWPGPLTLVLRASQRLPDEVTAGTGTVGVRVPASDLCRRLVELAGRPVISTSANLSGESPRRSVHDIRASLGKGVDLYLDAGTIPERPPSTVLDLSGPQPRLVRAGAIDAASLREALPGVEL